jgi:hypothetical protein
MNRLMPLAYCLAFVATATVVLCQLWSTSNQALVNMPWGGSSLVNSSPALARSGGSGRSMLSGHHVQLSQPSSSPTVPVGFAGAYHPPVFLTCGHPSELAAFEDFRAELTDQEARWTWGAIQAWLEEHLLYWQQQGLITSLTAMVLADLPARPFSTAPTIDSKAHQHQQRYMQAGYLRPEFHESGYLRAGNLRNWTRLTQHFEADHRFGILRRLVQHGHGRFINAYPTQSGRPASFSNRSESEWKHYLRLLDQMPSLMDSPLKLTPVCREVPPDVVGALYVFQRATSVSNAYLPSGAHAPSSSSDWWLVRVGSQQIPGCGLLDATKRSRWSVTVGQADDPRMLGAITDWMDFLQRCAAAESPAMQLLHNVRAITHTSASSV